ncbi:AAA family ATPase [Ruminococcus albus]|uniref:AAA family ATPase n=1 Tax=Ruminococcus albus TaxID=1264 RepID=UPI0001E09A91|nr:AAA family ATPase [Ruminococcus albus]
MTNAVRSEPNCVLLLDEIEKAHPKVYNALLQVMDYGMMTDSKGIKVDFTNTVIIMTSNAGAASIVKKNVGFAKVSETVDNSAMDKALEEKFPPEFRGRLTDVI